MYFIFFYVSYINKLYIFVVTFIHLNTSPCVLKWSHRLLVRVQHKASLSVLWTGKFTTEAWHFHKAVGTRSGVLVNHINIKKQSLYDLMIYSKEVLPKEAFLNNSTLNILPLSIMLKNMLVNNWGMKVLQYVIGDACIFATTADTIIRRSNVVYFPQYLHSEKKKQGKNCHINFVTFMKAVSGAVFPL